jgi:hypothetical protein
MVASVSEVFTVLISSDKMEARDLSFSVYPSRVPVNSESDGYRLLNAAKD